MPKTAQTPWGKTPRKRDSQFAVKREAVLRSAAALFREKGYDGASLNDLADILNITKPTIYYYVQSKEQLLVDILSVAQDEIITFMRVADATEKTGYDKLRRIMIDYAQIMVSDYGACLSRIWMGTLDPSSRVQVEKRIRDADTIIHKVLDEGQADGTIAVTDKTVALHALFGSLNWMASWVKPNRRLTPLKLAETHVDILLKGVRGGGFEVSAEDSKSKRPGKASSEA
jgi:AcrR family transcriptional regulator